MRRFLPLVLLAVACKDAPPPRPFDGAAALRYVETQMSFGPRIPGTAGHRRTGDWLDSLLRARADTVVVQSWTHLTAESDSLPMRNFLARFNPAATERLLLVAHWDTRPRADGPRSMDSTQAVPGANDGGSGVAVLLGVADALRQRAPSVGVDLLFVDGEDYGEFTGTQQDVLIGARYYAAHQPAGPKPAYAVVFDMVGARGMKVYQEGNSLTGAPEVVELVWNVARDIGHGDIFIDSPKHTVTDDHIELQKGGIRAIDVIDFDYSESWWHTPGDTIDKLAPESLAATGDLALGLVAHAERK